MMDPTNTRGIENWSVDPEDGSFKSSHGHSLLRSSAHHIKSEAVVAESDLRAKSRPGSTPAPTPVGALLSSTPSARVDHTCVIATRDEIG
jgi:hypothetical protein